MDSIGGGQYHTLTVEEMPPHNHVLNSGRGDGVASVSSATARYRDFFIDPAIGRAQIFYDQNYPRFVKTVVSSTGGGKPHNILPPYYALAYIIKTV